MLGQYGQGVNLPLFVFPVLDNLSALQHLSGLGAHRSGDFLFIGDLLLPLGCVDLGATEIGRRFLNVYFEYFGQVTDGSIRSGLSVIG
ncbi:hypothetical protein GCM10022278_13980 [Allohahella marinimesophila]|uniref:Uncharacterized protein n=1 Tax=Allohahella marinimesophila TaxID=1054972 RepID=A0ABP7NYF8_9GAMM